jgi:hypothetical protein
LNTPNKTYPYISVTSPRKEEGKRQRERENLKERRDLSTEKTSLSL